jgi:transposase-like protein
MKKHRSFKPEQKARAVLQVLTGQKSAAQICRELQIGESLLSRWKKHTSSMERAASLKKNPTPHKTASVSPNSSV